jgi:hypothetical protein
MSTLDSEDTCHKRKFDSISDDLTDDNLTAIQKKKEKKAKYDKEYNLANKERTAAYNKEYYKDNEEIISERRKAYYAANREKISERRKARREANKRKTDTKTYL